MNLLIVKLSSIGDVIHTLPAAAALRRGFPSATMTWVVERSSAQLLRGNPVIDHLVEIDTRSWRDRRYGVQTLKSIKQKLEELRARPYDIGFDFQGLLKSGLVLCLSRARRRIGFETACLREKFSLLFFTEQVPVSDQVHVIEKNLQVVSVLGIPTARPYEFPLAIADEDREFITLMLKKLNATRFAIVNPGGAWLGKRWPPERYAMMCDFLSARFGLASLTTHGPDEEKLAHEVAQASKGSAIPFPCTLKQLAVLADRASLFIGTDTGPLHLAAARGTPIVGLYGPTVSERNGPFNPQDIIVQDTSIQSSVYYRRRVHNERYLDIPIEAVERAVEKRLAVAGDEPRGEHRGKVKYAV
jgi:lipopolysaccharide heptosyltransferase I